MTVTIELEALARSWAMCGQCFDEPARRNGDRSLAKQRFPQRNGFTVERQYLFVTRGANLRHDFRNQSWIIRREYGDGIARLERHPGIFQRKLVVIGLLFRAEPTQFLPVKQTSRKWVCSRVDRCWFRRRDGHAIIVRPCAFTPARNSANLFHRRPPAGAPVRNDNGAGFMLESTVTLVSRICDALPRNRFRANSRCAVW